MNAGINSSDRTMAPFGDTVSTPSISLSSGELEALRPAHARAGQHWKAQWVSTHAISWGERRAFTTLSNDCAGREPGRTRGITRKAPWDGVASQRS
jgi:hypothetical protein